MNAEALAELYLSFAGIFLRPRPIISDNLEELIKFWSEEIPAPPGVFAGLREFCAAFPVGEARLNSLWEDYIPLFETGEVEAPPYASVYLSGEGLVMGAEAYAVQDFYVAAGYGINSESKELPDHLGVELEFLARLAQEGAMENMADFRQKHLLPFLKAILPRIIQARRPIFSQAAELLDIWQSCL